MTDSMTLEDRVAIVTGASRGIGKAIAVRCDIGVERDIEKLVAMALDRFGHVDILVNNAMTPTRGAFDQMSGAEWDRSMLVNVRSLFVSCRAVLPAMRARGAGSIINMSSGAADPFVDGMPAGYLTYCVAKAALERFSTALALEFAPDGIAVNALRPGAVRTEKSEQELGADFDWSGWAAPESVVPAALSGRAAGERLHRADRGRDGIRQRLALMGLPQWSYSSSRTMARSGQF